MPRPGGNPDFGKKYKFETDRPEPLNQKLTVKLTESMMGYLKGLGKDYPEFVREAIAEKIEQHKAAQLNETKTETTELATAGQQPPHNQTNQEGQTEETDPNQEEQGATPKTQRKAGQSQGQKQEKPTSQSRSRKSSATQKTREQDQQDKD
ncbi:hypothetical protein [Nostoc linckia]|uniref:hypothetical protein n=2 Tax=Nostoc linckia TaxID=92942 RepID=UPI000BFFE39B|nr:hypothetical protein [Nostoc linckia]